MQPAVSEYPRPPSRPSAGAQRKQDRDRIRVTRACDRCKRRKIRCSGIHPCEICLRNGASCSYNASYARGRLPLVPTSRGQGLVGHASPEAQDETLRASGPSDPSDVALPNSMLPDRDTEGRGGEPGAMHGAAAEPAAIPEPHPAVPSSRASPEPSQTDLQGHFVGPSSGVAFLLRVQRRLHQTVSFPQSSSIFTFGDAELPEYDPSTLLLLSYDEAKRLLDRYFDFAEPTHRFLHRPTAEAWLREFYDTRGRMRNKQDGPARTALLFMIFAQAQQYMAPETEHADEDMSARYFLAADHQLAKERGAVRLTSVQARLCQCFYLLSQSRINHCWNLFGTTVHLALAIGLNRSRNPEPSGGNNCIETECRRRTFWCAYSLDNYLSAALGRPRSFHDEDIDQEEPSCVEDCDLFADHVRTPPPRGQPLMLAPVFHVRLSRIVSTILRDLYSIRPIALHSRKALTVKSSRALKSWRAEIARFLDVDRVSYSLLQPIFQRQRTVLSLSYWHAMILAHRPFLLSNFARLQPQDGRRAGAAASSWEAEESVAECLQAAMSIVNTVDDLMQARQMFPAFWFTSYLAFSAVVVLYVYSIQQRAAPINTYAAYLDVATQCQKQLAQMAGKESLAQRYSLVLDELRLEALRQTERNRRLVSRSDQQASAPPSAPKPRDPTVLSGPDEVMLQPALAYALNGGDPPADLDCSPSSSLADKTSWGHFDSLVTSAYSSFDVLFNDPSLHLGA